MDLASKLKLLRNGVKRSEGQLKTMKHHTGRVAAKIGKTKERQREASKINDKILSQMQMMKAFVEMGGPDREYQQNIENFWQGSMGQPGLTDLVKEHGKLNGYDEEDIEERLGELEEELEEYYNRLFTFSQL